jgi:hypothetical protein
MFFILTLSILLMLTCETPASAYTDPGSGLMLMQILGSVFISVAFYARKLLRRFKK